MKKNATDSSALNERIKAQENQSLNLNEWIFSQIELNSEDQVLELCCGTGAQTDYFNRKVNNGTLRCVDINEESIRINKKRTKNSQISYMASELDDIDNYATQNFDLIFCAYGFYYSGNARALHSSLKTKLTPGGRFVLVGPTLGNNIELYKIVEKLGFDVPDHVMYSSERFMLDFLKLFLENYNRVRFLRVTNQISYSNHENLLNYWKNTTFYTPCPDDEFLSMSKELFSSRVHITKSIALLEGIN